MSDHIGGANKKISDCPGCGAARGPYANTFLCGSKECKDGKVARSTRCEHRQRDDLLAQLHWLRVELESANDRIKRLEEAGDAAIHEAAFDREVDALEIWTKAKEDKP